MPGLPILDFGILTILVLLVHVVQVKNKRSFFYLGLELVESVILRFDGHLHTKLHITQCVTDIKSLLFTKELVSILTR